MHGMHARLPRNFVLEERIERYADHIELTPQAYAGHWTHACHPLSPHDPSARYDEVRLDLGCGKGAFVCEMARQNPNVLFVAIDFEPLCVVYTAQHAKEAELANVVAVPARGNDLPQLFAPGELGRIYLNFPTPFPRKKEADKRLVALERLLEYRTLLAPGCELQLKTDSQPLRDFALTQLELACYEINWSTDDARSILADEPKTEYELRLTAQGAPVFALAAHAGADPSNPRQSASLSLVDYLPDDLESLTYVPYGMEGCVTNLRNRRARGRSQ